MPSLGVPSFVVRCVDQTIINVLVDCLYFVSCCVHTDYMHLPFVLVPVLEYTQLCLLVFYVKPFPNSD